MTTLQPVSAADGPPQGLPKISSGVAGLDEVLLGGFPEGRTTVLGGGPGAGKTVFGLEFAYRHALAGQGAVFASFEERAEEIRANARSLGWDLERLEREKKLALVAAALPQQTIESGSFDFRGLYLLLENRLRALDARIVVLDAVDGLFRIVKDPELLRREFVGLHAWLRDHGLTAVLTVKASQEALLYPFLEFLADCVVVLDQRFLGQVRTRRLRVVKYRGSNFLGNEHPFLIAASGVRLLPIASLDLVQKPLGERLSTGIGRLDEYLGGGFRRGASVLIGGSSGTGKTTLACTFARAACERGERVLYVSLEESEQNLLDSVRSAGIDLRPVQASGKLRVVTAMPESAGIEEHLVRLLTAIEAHGADHIVLDAISAVQRMGDERAAFDFLVRLLGVARARGITCLYTNQMLPDDAERISGVGMSSLIDTAISLQLRGDERELRRRLVIIKSRGSRHSLRYHLFTIGDDGLHVGEAPAEGASPGEVGR
ncbi:MAG: circadian clock protein KaiC [Candidatus Krumholzibacteriia bacterium]